MRRRAGDRPCGRPTGARILAGTVVGEHRLDPALDLGGAHRPRGGAAAGAKVEAVANWASFHRRAGRERKGAALRQGGFRGCRVVPAAAGTAPVRFRDPCRAEGARRGESWSTHALSVPSRHTKT